VVLTGPTGYDRVNKLTIECEIDKGDDGVAAVKFLGGVTNGIQGVRFPAPKVIAKPGSGRIATVTGTDRSKSEHKLAELQALYAVEGGQKLASTLFFKKTLKVDLAKVQKIVPHSSTTEGGTEWDVTLKDGDTNTLTLITQEVKLDGKSAALLGLVGKAPVGFKIFSLPSVAEIQFEEGK
jgi:hypothetical protein